MLCIAWHPVTHQFPYENRMGLQWQLTCIQMFSLTHKHVFKLSRPTHGLQTSEPNRRGSFLNITIISLYCNARTDWLSPGETNTDPRVIQEVGSRRGDAIFARSANIHTRTCTRTHTHTLTPLHSETKHILNAPLPTVMLPPIWGFSVWYGLQLRHRGWAPIQLWIKDGREVSPALNCCLRTERQEN